MSNITVVDGICGSGKSSWSIEYMNDLGSRAFGSKQFIYVTPYLSEIERVKKACSKLEFKDPTNNGNGKLSSLKHLIANGDNIATTHNLFKAIDVETIELLKNSGYILILDEVLNVINEYEISKSDMDILFKSDTCEIVDGRLIWKDINYKDGKFNDLFMMSGIGNIYYYRNKFLFWTVTPESFKVFDEVYILTYLFDGQIQRYFYDMHNIKYEMKSVTLEDGKYKLVDYNNKLDDRNKLKELLSIFENTTRSKLNSNYVLRVTNTTLSSTNLKNMPPENIHQLKKNMYSFFNNHCEAKTNEIFWTTLNKFAPKMKSKLNTYKTIKDENRNVIYDKNKCNFISHNIRATNDYRDRRYCAYVYNRFMHPIERAFFEDNGVTVNEELLALSDLIQWVFRGCIRNGEHMKIYIPSSRMRKLLYDYLDYKI